MGLFDWGQAQPSRTKTKYANHYPECPAGHRAGWIAKSRAEVSARGARIVVRQLFQCSSCGLRARLKRYQDSASWDFRL
jgi:hypothetical protein